VHRWRSAGISARNLLTDCARLAAGDRLLILHEDPALGYYDAEAPRAVAAWARELGIRTTLTGIGFAPDADTIDGETAAMMGAADCTIFFARIGDQVRFRTLPKGTRAVVCYALDFDSLVSGFGTASWSAFTTLAATIDAMLADAREIRVTCPLGTDFSGPGPGHAPRGDVTISRFPMSVFAPVPAAEFGGTVAISDFLLGTGSKYYAPYGCALDGVLAARFDSGRLLGFEGGLEDVSRAEAHYDAVSSRYGIDRNAVHSWHAGIHPGCAFRTPAWPNGQRWSGSAFGNPRILHLHTCGAYAPGEISWNVIDPTVTVDGVAVWENGRLHPDRITGGSAVLKDPLIRSLFMNPETEIGVFRAA
jgi:hypothetical protein